MHSHTTHLPNLNVNQDMMAMLNKVNVDENGHCHLDRNKDHTLKGKPKCFTNLPFALSFSPLVLAKAQVVAFITIFLFVRWFCVPKSPIDPYSLKEYLICDRSDYRTDVCRMKGDVRVDGKSKSILLCSQATGNFSNVQKLKPYPSKWEEHVMSTISEITLREIDAEINSSSIQQYSCDVRHKVPAVVFSAGGHSNNFYHAFQDGIIPMFIAASRFHGEVVFVILDYHNRWMAKYGEIFRQLSHYDPVDFNNDTKLHCFPEATVGLKVHDILAIDSSIDESVSMAAFQKMLHDAYAEEPRREKEPTLNKNKEEGRRGGEGEKMKNDDGEGDGENKKRVSSMLIISREGSSRYMVNEEAMAEMAREMGFRVTILKKLGTLKLKDVYMQVQACDVMVGVHGAGMAHLLFLRPGSSLIQVTPLGIKWAARTYYGKPAQHLGLRYVEYNILPQESNLSKQYPQDHPFLVDPDKDRGWESYERIFLYGQNVTLDLLRFRNVLLESYKWATKP